MADGSESECARNTFHVSLLFFVFPSISIEQQCGCTGRLVSE